MATTLPEEEKQNRSLVVRPSLLPQYIPDQTPGKRRRPSLLGLVVVVTVILGVLVPVSLFMYKSLFPAATTILITPRVVIISQNITLDAVTLAPTSTQIQIRTISVSSLPIKALAYASGAAHQSAKFASGLLSLYNMAPRVVVVPAGTIFIAPSGGVQISTDTEAVLSPAHLPQMGTMTVNAHALEPGSGGNVGVMTWNNCPTCQPGTIARNFQTFSGGQDASTTPLLQQGDINRAAKPLITQLMASTPQLLTKQVRVDEKLLSSTIHCQPRVQPNRSVGNQVAETEVKVMMNCTGETYNLREAHDTVQSQITAHVDAMYTGTYIPIGIVSLIEEDHTLSKNTSGAFSIAFQAEGRWVAQLNTNHLHQITQTLAQMSSSDARALLLREPGVQEVTIPGNFLPIDGKDISFRIVD